MYELGLNKPKLRTSENNPFRVGSLPPHPAVVCTRLGEAHDGASPETGSANFNQ